VAHAQVLDEEDVGVAEGAHGDVARGPRPDPGQRQQPAPRLGAVGAGIHAQLAVGQRAAEADERPRSRVRHGQALGVERRERRRRREERRDGAARSGERLAVLGHEMPRTGARGRH
jgi:hypothetical protein